jgi:transcriptional regulator with XRE-family HTH domain
LPEQPKLRVSAQLLCKQAADTESMVSNRIPLCVRLRYNLAMNAAIQHAQAAASLLAESRDQAGLSLREVARRAGTSHATLLAYERGTKTPSIVTFLRVLDACGFAVDFDLSPRIRWQDGISRGEELAAVLGLAEQFPARVSRHMNYPAFGTLSPLSEGGD